MIEITIPDFNNPLEVTWWAFLNGGWIVVVIAILYGIWWMYLDYIQTRFVMNTKYILLAIDVPKENEQTPKSVEHMFSHFAGIYKNPNFLEKYRDGYIQPTITVELISIDGYVQFLIRVQETQRDLAEAAIYAQYPNAEIAEVEDYVGQFEAKFPNDKFNLWGCEMALTNSEAYPIRTYPAWEHSLTQTFLDPLATTLEMMGRMRKGEQMWFQWILRPNNGKWREKGLDLINKLISLKSAKNKSGGALSTLTGAPGQLAVGAWETVTRTLFEPGESNYRNKDDNAPPSMMMHLPANTKAVIEGIGMKISKIGFDVKFRTLYIADHNLYSKRAAIANIVGSVNQYNTLDMNGFRIDSKTKTSRDFFFVKRRVAHLQRKLLLGYKYRSNWRGRRVYVLNIEELASLWHFPVITVKAPQVKKQEAKRGEPPVLLPVGEEIEYVPKKQPEPEPETPPPAVSHDQAKHTGAPPTNLPV